MKPQNAKRKMLLLLLPLLGLLPGCATLSTPSPVACPQIPPKPYVDMPQNSPRLSERAMANSENWRNWLTNTGTQQKP